MLQAKILQRYQRYSPGVQVTVELAGKFWFRWHDCERMTKVRLRESNGYVYRTIRYCDKCGDMQLVTPGSPMSGPGEMVHI